MPFITAENAVELGRKSGEARREARKQVEYMTANLLTLAPLANPSNYLIQEPDLARAVAELVKIVTEQISHTRQLLNEERTAAICPHCGKECGHTEGMEHNHRAQLLKALDALIERKTSLLGIPGPGQLKPTSPRSPRQPACLPIVAPVQAEPTTGSVQPSQAEPQEPKST